MKLALAFALIGATAATSASAQDFGFTGRTYSVDLGLGAKVGPEFPGSDEGEASPWLIWRNGGFESGEGEGRQGFSISPSYGMVGDRESNDYPELAGMKDIDHAYELGLKLSYSTGPVTAFGSVRRGFDGHEGVVGELGAKYRTELSDRVTLWSGVEVGYGSDEYTQTYFGVTPEEVAAGRPVYTPGGGFTSAAITFEARYAVTDTIAVLGEIQYGKLIGDAADSPIVQEEYQPSLRLGIVRKFSFGF